MTRSSGKMEWCEALLVYLVDVSSAFNELVDHHILPVVTGHMEGCVTIRIGLIDLDTGERQRVVMTRMLPRIILSFYTKDKKLVNYYSKL